MSPAARAWLAARAGGVPPSLEARMEQAVDDVAADGKRNVDALGSAALDCLRHALRSGNQRAAALHLLAADGLITAACAAAIEAGAGLDELCEALAPAALAAALQLPASRR